MDEYHIPSPSGTVFSSPPNPETLTMGIQQAEAPLPATHLSSYIGDYSNYDHIPVQHLHVQGDDDNDIYRGASGAPPECPPSPLLSLYAQSSVSTISSEGRGRRRGTLAAIVEAAIARWGRPSSDDSSSSSSSSSSSTSLSHSRIRSRRRKGSTTTTTITRAKTPAQRAQARKVIKITKRVPRDFTLFLPHSLCPADGLSVRPDSRPAPTPLGQPVATESQRTLRTRHIKLIVAQLEAALKKNARDLRAADRDRLKSQQVAPSKSTELTASAGLGTTNIPKVVLEVPTPPNRTPKAGTADLRESTIKQPVPVEKQSAPALGLSGVDNAKAPSKPLANVSGPALGNRAWWLDVASPSWEDMRVLGKLLHLHPLTLEDILQEEPREKLELFPRLGYYFVVFRALETQAALQRPRPPDAEQEGTIGAVNVYFVVFREGIVTFHFEDIAEHADRVRQKIIEFEQTIQMSSDWISHGLMDSMVDAFVPLLRTIDKEVEGVDALITNPENSLESVPPSEITIQGDSSDAIEEKVQELEKSEKPDLPNSYPQIGLKLRSRIKSLKRRMWSLLPKRLRWKEKAVIVEPPTKLATFQTLLRMATTRRLVTSLVRLLATKSEVIGQLRKRLQGGSGGAVDWDEGDMARGQEVGIYLGDVQDHILTMQQSLNHYERILSHDHPAYIAHLRLLLSEAKGDKDKMILTLSIIIFTVPAMQFPMGLGGMNVEVPTQRGTPYYTYFFIWLGVSLGVMLAVLALVWWWWTRAKKKRRTGVKL